MPPGVQLRASVESASLNGIPRQCGIHGLAEHTL